MQWNDDGVERASFDARPPGGPSGRDELVAIMARLADGDDAAVVTLLERFGAPIAGAVRRAARTRPGRLDAAEVDVLVLDVCFELQRVAAGWSPDGGALPWVWARHRVENVVDRHLGTVGDVLDEDRLAELDDRAVEGAERVEAGSMFDALERVAPDMASARLLTEAFEEAAISRRDREVLFEYAFEKASGNRAPAVTVAAAFDMKEATVRQAFRRARRRLRDLIARDEPLLA
jgi:DNA-directed RNA polymerase specialized sigma24 family protein